MTTEEERAEPGVSDDEAEYRPARAWTYPRDRWGPRWWHKLGWPYLAGDEFGRRTVVVGLWFVGYVCIALWTCYCDECHESRVQTYGEMWEHRQPKPAPTVAFGQPLRVAHPYATGQWVVAGWHISEDQWEGGRLVVECVDRASWERRRAQAVWRG